MLKKVSAIALVALAVISVAGCAETVEGKGKASGDVTKLNSVKIDDIKLPEESFYGDDVEVSDDPDSPYQRLCDSPQTFTVPDGVDTKVRKVMVSPPSVGGDDANIYIDETVLVFKDAKGAEDFVKSFDDTAKNCPSDDSSSTGDSTVTYTYAKPDEVDKDGWHGWTSEITLDIEPTSGSPTQGSEVDQIAQQGNVVAYASWESDPVDDVDDAMGQIHDKIDEFFTKIVSEH